MSANRKATRCLCMVSAPTRAAATIVLGTSQPGQLLGRLHDRRWCVDTAAKPVAVDARAEQQTDRDDDDRTHEHDVLRFSVTVSSCARSDRPHESGKKERMAESPH
jgi:hypothetical protein